MATPFDPTNPSIEAVRQIVFERLRADSGWSQLDPSGSGFDPYTEYEGDAARGRPILNLYAREVFWQLVCEGIVTPGLNSSNLNLPFFRVTGHGRKVLAEADFQPYDPSGYMTAVERRIADPDNTVMAYLAEAVLSFRRGSVVAAMTMLGIAAERVFDLVCESLLNALNDPGEKATFEKLMNRFPMKPKLDWVHNKLQDVQRSPGTAIPENSAMMATVIYDLLRMQRNELGHPRDAPPRVDRDEAVVNLQIFPRYYDAAERVRQFLASNGV